MRLLALFLAALCSMLSPGAQAQNGPVRIIVPIPPRPSADLLARLIAPKLSAGLGQPVVAENHAGAAGIIGADLVARAAPDGQTIASTSQMVSAPLLSKVPYDRSGTSRRSAWESRPTRCS